LINPLEHPSFLLEPKRLKLPYSWIEHVPFAMFLVDLLRPKLLVELGTHTGNSYCAFCQAVKELSINTRCFAVDTWKGDKHAHFYGEEVLQELIAFHDPLYGEFSMLIQSTFDNALDNFDNKTIDLLHIDGMHTYEEVKHDFESWLPKMSTRGVILLHDTNVRVGDFGVWKLWQDLHDKYPTFEFIHGNGLGVVYVGCESFPELENLFKQSKNQVSLFRDFFYKGFGSKLSYQVKMEAQAADRDQKIADRDQKIAELNEIKRSKTWKMALLFRRIRKILIPKNSIRERILRKIYKLAMK